MQFMVGIIAAMNCIPAVTLVRPRQEAHAGQGNRIVRGMDEISDALARGNIPCVSVAVRVAIMHHVCDGRMKASVRNVTKS